MTGPTLAEQFEPAFTAIDAPFTPVGPQQPLTDPSRGPYAIHMPDEGQILAQTFMPTRNWELGYVELPVTCVAGAVLNIKIREGVGGPILSDFNHAAPSTPSGFQLFQINNPSSSRGIRIRRRVTYALELSAFHLGSDPTLLCNIMAGPAGDTYAGGQAWYKYPFDPGFLPLPTGNPTDSEDLPFITLVR
jgi:hypothetical protein